MNITRLEAFSDAVMAIILTITVLGIHVPENGSVSGLLYTLPPLLTYAWSFQTIGTYWNNHHHMLKAVSKVSTTIMWANLFLLFWISLVPFTTEWLGEHVGEVWPTFAYSAVLFASAIAYTILEYSIARQNSSDWSLLHALGYDKKGMTTLACYVIALVLSFINPWIAYVFVAAVAFIWFIPDTRLLRLKARKKPL